MNTYLGIVAGHTFIALMYIGLTQAPKQPQTLQDQQLKEMWVECRMNPENRPYVKCDDIKKIIDRASR